MFKFIFPQKEINEQQLNKGLNSLLGDGICSQIMGTLTGGVFLVAYALAVGASNTVIGTIAAIGPFTQLLQIPAIYLINRIRLRKLLLISSALLSRLFWVPIILIPWLNLKGPAANSFLLACLSFYFGFGAISGCAFNSWMRDLIPQGILGKYNSKRMATATALGAILSLGAGFGADYLKNIFGNELLLYSTLFIIGLFFGFLGIWFLSRVPEPEMDLVEDANLLDMLIEPFKNLNFRSLIAFLGLWNFAINLAAPFFTVYMLKRLGLSLGWVIIFSVLSQLVNVWFLKLWGRMSDRFSNKSVLAVSGPLFLISILMWPFTTLPEKYVLTIPLLIAIHILAGMSTAGVTLCSGNIALKLAPKGSATAYLAINAVISGLAATIAPILAGGMADWFSSQELTITLGWKKTLPKLLSFQLQPINFKGLDFLFGIAVVAGLYAMHRLLAVKEEGTVDENIILSELHSEVRKAVKNTSNVAGLRHLTYFPYAILTDSIKMIAKTPRRILKTGKKIVFRKLSKKSKKHCSPK